MLTITPDPLTAGGAATIQISGSSKNSQSVEVQLSDGMGQSDATPVTLDPSGDGSTTWTVPSGWDQVVFEYGTCEPVTVLVE